MRRRDACEQPITAALEAVGADVTQVSGKGAPDILVRFRGQLFAAEIKAAKGKPTAAQQQTRWPIWRSVAEALGAIGVNS